MKWTIIGIYLFSICWIHFRGRVRLPFHRQVIDHSALFAPMNLFMYLFSKVPASPYLPLDYFRELKTLQDNWQMIRGEAQSLMALEKIKRAEQNNDAGFNSFFKNGWTRFYLKWYDANHPSAQKFCPNTTALLATLPTVKAAMFAELKPGGTLNPHRDPYAGSLRYHLGLITPNDDRCYIEVDGKRYSWRDGEGVVFDETYVHTAHNGSQENRVILFCDIERPMRYRWTQAINKWLGKKMMTAASSPNETGDQVGGVNKLFRFVWIIGQYRRRLKNWNRTVYHAVRLALLVAVVLAIIYL